jgi:hypothetical protein
MATLVDLGPDDVLIVRTERDLEEHEVNALVNVKDLIGFRAVFVLTPGVELSSLPADEVLRAVAGA